MTEQEIEKFYNTQDELIQFMSTKLFPRVEDRKEAKPKLMLVHTKINGVEKAAVDASASKEESPINAN